MAANPNSVQCRYFAAGCCNREGCSFAHDRTARADSICRYYVQGTCFYGDHCRYDHVRPERSARSVPPHSYSPVKFNHTGAVPKPRSTQSNIHAKDDLKENFVPGSQESRKAPASYAQAVDANALPSRSHEGYKYVQMCQYAMTGTCPLGDKCQLGHGDVCAYCQCQVLDPNDPVQRATHEKECSANFERDMEYSFALQRSAQKSCTICLEVVLEQTDAQKHRFGILENCLHTFCFDCIMKWRKQSRESLDQKAIRSCPECRVHSDYVIPSHIWPETSVQKIEVIAGYKNEMKKRHCKHYDHGRGKCPFGGKCWFLHTLPDGTPVTLPDPKPRRHVRGDGLTSFLTTYSLSDFLEFSDDDEEDDDDLYPSDYDFDEFDDWYGGLAEINRVSLEEELSNVISNLMDVSAYRRGRGGWNDDGFPVVNTPVDTIIEDLPNLFERNAEEAALPATSTCSPTTPAPPVVSSADSSSRSSQQRNGATDDRREGRHKRSGR